MAYITLCALVGLAVGWLPKLAHGPIAYKFNIHGIRGDIAVWGWYTARLAIGFIVGITRWPERWYLRGPLCGALMLLPLGFVALATPECGGA